jgi:hypothetical protein
MSLILSSLMQSAFVAIHNVEGGRCFLEALG